jgi:hypothetical protein
MSTEIKRLPADWSKDLGIDVLDPDGWRTDGTPWGLAITEQDFRRRAAMSTMREVADPAPLDLGVCAHGTPAEDLCNAMPAKVELDAMWTAWKSLTPAEQQGWLEGGEGKVPTPAKIQLAKAVGEFRIGQPGDLREGDVVVQVPKWHTNADSGISGLIGDVVIRREVPAPKPEWKPGTTGTAHVVSGDATTKEGRVFRKVRGMVVHRPAPIDDDMFVTTEGDLWGLEGEYCKNFVPDEPRPLPTADEVQRMLIKFADGYWETDKAAVAAFLAFLGGESR